MRIADKYAQTDTEKAELNAVSLFANAETAFENHCANLIVKAYFKALEEGKFQASWNEVTITRHLKKHLKICILEEALQYFVAPEYPEDDDNIDDGIKNAAEEVYFDLIFSSFSNASQHYFGVEAKIVIENDYLKRKATVEISEYVSKKGMRKFLESVYKKRGCMLGYLIEGSADTVVLKINDKIKADIFYENTGLLEKGEPIDGFEQYYESVHLNYSRNPLRHFFLNIALKN